jgi:cathepsin A (carboxypeptidase C)
MIAFYRDIVPRLKITFVYNGDTDPCVSYEGTRTAVKRFGFEELDGGSQRPWFYNMTGAPLEVLATKSPLFGPNLVSQNMGAQLGGEVISYESGLSFLTIHGSGHMVPQFRPQAALHMLDRLVRYADLSPLYPGNATLAKMSDELFHKVMDKWTETAQGQPYVTCTVWDSTKGDAARIER